MSTMLYWCGPHKNFSALTQKRSAISNCIPGYWCRLRLKCPSIAHKRTEKMASPDRRQRETLRRRKQAASGIHWWSSTAERDAKLHLDRVEMNSFGAQ